MFAAQSPQARSQCRVGQIRNIPLDGRARPREAPERNKVGRTVVVDINLPHLVGLRPPTDTRQELPRPGPDTRRRLFELRLALARGVGPACPHGEPLEHGRADHQRVDRLAQQDGPNDRLGTAIYGTSNPAGQSLLRQRAQGLPAVLGTGRPRFGSGLHQLTRRAADRAGQRIDQGVRPGVALALDLGGDHTSDDIARRSAYSGCSDSDDG